MKLWHWARRRAAIPGQSRPRGLFLERVPAEAGLAAPVAPLWLPPEPPEPVDPVREQFAGVRQFVDGIDAQLAGLRRAVVGLGGQLAAVPTAPGAPHDEVAAQAVVRALEMAGLLAYARQLLGAYGADRALLASLTPPPELETWFERVSTGIHRR